ncbi:transcriptional regulator CriR [Salmonella enterica subsp. enterica]|uniref:Transcriptional regulator CriR n=1 Tax=Salmonella enterica I TaxID=59201 RepID=A0A3S4HGV4_SALET|nr:transcriptional regulator CriR [Salmonella enterica subsp. enterica]
MDNYLPDGKGITLLHELMQSRYPGGVVFTTAASDMETVAEAVRSGAFDYLVKPIAYERLWADADPLSTAPDVCWRARIAQARSR